MVKSYGSLNSQKFKNHIKADVIILGCSLPGIITAHNLKKTFGASMNIVVLEFTASSARLVTPTRGVAFKDVETENESTVTLTEPFIEHVDNITHYYLEKYAKDLSIPPTTAIPQHNPMLNKLFQYVSGQIKECASNYHDFEYINFFERFELQQYHTALNYKMLDLFHANASVFETDTNNLLYYDRTTMEQHLTDALFMATSREIMRTIVRLVCGTESDKVSVLFYLHQCYRVNSSKNHIDGDNTRFREKLLGRFQNRLVHVLQNSIADITMKTKPIEKIRISSEERVVLEPVFGETDYICNLLAMALRPDQVSQINLPPDLLAERDKQMLTAMKHGVARKFIVQYEKNFWRREGFSGDILSVKGPVLWATECPKETRTRASDKYATLIGYLKTDKDKIGDNKEAVLKQLVNLFGEDAATPVSYQEYPIKDIYIPRCGDFVALRQLKMDNVTHLEWNSLDIFAEGDVAGAMEAGHTAYLQLLRILRPQALSYDALLRATPLHVPEQSSIPSSLNLISTSKFLLFSAALAVGFTLIKSYFRK